MSKKKIGVYEVDKGVDIPKAITPKATLPPLGLLEVGESVLFSLSLRGSVQTVASKLKREQNKEFVVRKVNEAFARVWRIK